MLHLYKYILLFGESKRKIEESVYAKSQEEADEIIANAHPIYNYTWERKDA